MARITSGVVEMFTAAFLGIALDVVLETSPEKSIAEQGIFICNLCFCFNCSAIFFNISAYAKSVIVVSNLRKLVATRLLRWTLGHLTSFFENDFAGRIA